MLKTKIIVQYDGFVSKTEIGRLLMLAASFEKFEYLEVNEPGGKATYSCRKEKEKDG